MIARSAVTVARHGFRRDVRLSGEAISRADTERGPERANQKDNEDPKPQPSQHTRSSRIVSTARGSKPQTVRKRKAKAERTAAFHISASALRMRHYDDECVKQEGDWKIKTIRLTRLHVEEIWEGL